MASGHATASLPSFYCYKCDQHIVPIVNSKCPNCNEGFIEEVAAVQQVPGRPRQHMLGTPFGLSQTIFVGGMPSEGAGNGFEQMLQTFIHQITGGSAENIPFRNIIMQPGSGLSNHQNLYIPYAIFKSI
ncbi:unnamed protein product [Didymodactylos carnosus]|uniref:RING-type E3 ubiquitin transferase n=1 Tax=Didymodactylos carnosus TaxID=1234261 RepID=A0A814M5N9_9BILA|nr:unnamed protein product [Didymodactylos carnosus]CAF1594573.1 unnamed protein product [Didymodactylos carnosus]CAF3841563.1 unnamed protein product [Didymodactylos carnosus]CAF4399934.1 unnamed protein product [Didymodactylos carnosus]